MEYSKKIHRHHSNIMHGSHHDTANKTPFFTKANTTNVQAKEQPFFQTKLTIGKPNDKYEQEADAMADAVVSQSNKPNIQQKEISSIQRLATPEAYEKESTADGQMAMDKEIQEKRDPAAGSGLVQRMEATEEEGMAQPKLQLKAEEEEMAQPKLQLKAEEEEMAQPKLQLKAEEEEMAQPKLQLKEEEDTIQEKQDPLLQRACDGCGDEKEVQKKGDASTASNDVSQKIDQTKGSGSRMDSKTQEEMGSAFNTDFSNVNIHTGKDAQDLNQSLGAQAFATGSDIYFNEGKYDPGSQSGKHLLAHELTHVKQQGAA